MAGTSGWRRLLLVWLVLQVSNTSRAQTTELSLRPALYEHRTFTAGATSRSIDNVEQCEYSTAPVHILYL